MFPTFAEKTLALAAEKALKRTLRPVYRLSSRECVIGGKHFLDFSSNDYLGFSVREEVKEGAVRWTEKYGAGSGAARLISGTSDACLELEKRIASWKGFEAALIVGSGYMANLGVVESLARRSSAVFADKLNHASLNKGCTLSQARFLRYRHCDMEQLKILAERDPFPEGLLTSDTVFSMDGDIAPLEELSRIAADHSLVLYLDDAHGSGVFGKHGKGLAGPENCDLALTTFSKALGSYGGAVCCSARMKEYLIQSCAPFIFSTALPPAALGATEAALDLLMKEETDVLRERLLRMSAHVRDELKTMGYNTGASRSMVIPVIIGDADETLRFSASLSENGIYALAVRPPTVPAGTSRIRLSLNASHTDMDLEKLLEVFRRLA